MTNEIEKMIDQIDAEQWEKEVSRFVDASLDAPSRHNPFDVDEVTELDFDVALFR
jgi:hypothetical protein